jgi:hypothetical protein
MRKLEDYSETRKKVLLEAETKGWQRVGQGGHHWRCPTCVAKALSIEDLATPQQPLFEAHAQRRIAADFAMCQNLTCPARSRCLRYRARPDSFAQSWALFTPGEEACDSFVDLEGTKFLTVETISADLQNGTAKAHEITGGNK